MPWRESADDNCICHVGIALIGWIVVLLDWLARRKDRQSEHRRSA
jgi:hypothetical protein